ncbi:hypothetical protein pETSU_098 [Edwardsiella phage pEt-SU]|uniref:Uncharacterized protein n=1 Tax=Edwardsiella phage pEt-SU TaxID=2562142 RepID=A0A4D6DYC9_9CAUD|nr:hypothetical protein HOV39_gp098 [Edwardsiella phage pEt-SU]QBZ70679.1 hypothetical protein pETSU_098 [Edwardsiella phage pEt-SU]
MSRASDIRTYIVARQPSMTIDELYVLVAQLHASVDALISLRQNNEKPPMTVEVKNIALELRGNKLHTKEGIVFTPSSLQTFTETLLLMKGAMGLGSRTFATLIPELYGDLLLACANVETDVAKINSEIFSGLLKRYHNRARVGANNDYQFKYRLSTCKSRFITFDLKNMTFDDKDHVDFDIEVNDPILQEALGGHHRYPMPTGKVASQRISDKLKCAFTEVQSEDAILLMVNKLRKYGMELHEVYDLLEIVAGWVCGKKLALTVVCQDFVCGHHHVSFARAEPDFDKVSVVIHDEGRSIILGDKFSAKEIVDYVNEPFIKERVRNTRYLPNSVINSMLIMDSKEREIYFSLIEKEINPDHIDFATRAAPVETRLVVVAPMVYTDDVLFRLHMFSDTSVMTTLSLVSHREALESSRTIRALMSSIEADKREVDWTNVITPKVGFWAKVKRLFKAA